jgi:type I restriction enzyme M protein
MGLLFLRQATNRYYEARATIEADKATGKIPDRPLVDADFRRRRAMMLPEAARYDVILEQRKDGKLGEKLTAAMDAIELHFPPLAGQFRRRILDFLSSPNPCLVHRNPPGRLDIAICCQIR